MVILLLSSNSGKSFPVTVTAAVITVTATATGKEAASMGLSPQ
jgi:hypothetical protein